MLDAYMFPKIPTTSTGYGKHELGRAHANKYLLPREENSEKDFEVRIESWVDKGEHKAGKAINSKITSLSSINIPQVVISVSSGIPPWSYTFLYWTE